MRLCLRSVFSVQPAAICVQLTWPPSRKMCQPQTSTHPNNSTMSHNPLVSESESSSSSASPSFRSIDNFPPVSQLHLSPEAPDGIIQNELLKSKITMNASMILERLPVDKKEMLEKITEPSAEKITIRCQPIGSTPMLSPNVFKISYHQPMATLIKFITRKLKKSLPAGATLYCYVNNSFSPSPDEVIGTLFEHFAHGDELLVSYCTVVAFG